MTPAIVLTALALSAFVAWRVGRFLHRKDGGMMPISLSSEFLNHAVYRRPWWELYEPIFRASINAEFTGRKEDEMTAQEWMNKHGLKIGDEVRVYRPDREWNGWVGSMNDTVGKTLKIKYCAGNDLLLGNNLHYRTCCLEPVRPTYTLDRDAIRKRFSEAVVVIARNGEINIAIPLCGTYETGRGATFKHFNINRGCPQNIEIAKENGASLIRPGDKCEVSENNFECFKVGCTFDGFTGNTSYPFRIIHGSGAIQNYAFIRPLSQITPEQKARLKQIEKIERDIESAQERLAELKQMDK